MEWIAGFSTGVETPVILTAHALCMSPSWESQPSPAAHIVRYAPRGCRALGEVRSKKIHSPRKSPSPPEVDNAQRWPAFSLHLSTFNPSPCKTVLMLMPDQGTLLLAHFTDRRVKATEVQSPVCPHQSKETLLEALEPCCCP